MSQLVRATVMYHAGVGRFGPEYGVVHIGSSSDTIYDEDCEQIKEIMQGGMISIAKKDEPEPERRGVFSINVTENTGNTLFDFGQGNNARTGKKLF